MAKVQIVKQSFTNEKTGEIIPYERLCLSGAVNGEVFTLELKLEKSELQLAKMILASTEEINTNSRAANAEEEEAFFKQNAGRNSSDTINLEEE